jgi:hypothetical protein
VDDISWGEAKLTLDGVKAGPVFPSHLDHPVFIGERQKFEAPFCHYDLFRRILGDNPWPT